MQNIGINYHLQDFFASLKDPCRGQKVNWHTLTRKIHNLSKEIERKVLYLQDKK